jgi:hypothetical protein
MGEVYLAEDTSLKRKVALEFLPVVLQADPIPLHGGGSLLTVKQKYQDSMINSSQRSLWRNETRQGTQQT